MPSSETQVIVVGAGISGLSAAKWLDENGVNAIVLEARDRVGGRTFTKWNDKVKYVDVGGAYVGPTQNHLLRMAKELNVETYKVNEEEAILHYRDGKRTTFYGGGLPGTYNPLVYLDINNFFRTIDEMGEQIPADAPWDAPKAKLWDSMTFKEFIDKTCFTYASKSLATLFINICVTSEPYEASLLWYLWYVKQCGGVQKIISTSNGGQERKFVGGSQQLSLKIAERLQGKVLLEKPVHRLQQNEKGVSITTLDGQTYKADYVILALPPPIQMKIHYDPPLPADRNQLLQRMPMGSVFKIILYYEKNFWRPKGLCGSLMIEANEEHPTIFVLDDTKPDGTHPALIGFICADKCRSLLNKSKEDRLDLLKKSFYKVTKLEEMLHPIHYEEFCWAAEQYSGGCYTSMCPPGLLTQYGRCLRKPVGRMYFAGTETATKWSGYIEGGIQAGERAAREVMCEMGLIPQSMIWREEPESKEVVATPVDVSFVERHLPSVPTFLKMLKLTVFGVGIASCVMWYCKSRLQSC